MNIFCTTLGHKRASAKSWDGEFYHSSCARCGAVLVRLTGDRDWREPLPTEVRYFDMMKEQAAVPAQD